MKTSSRICLWLALLVAALATFIFLKTNQLVAQDERFVPPSGSERAEAVGVLSRVPRGLRSAFDPADDSFRPIPKPGPSDWLANHAEPGQSYSQYRLSRPNRPDETRKTIYLQPIGDFDTTDGPSLEKVAEYARCFFALPVKLLPMVPDDQLTISERRITERHHHGNRQMLSTDILSWLEPRVPDDGYCLLAVTMIDLYPDPKWNFVFGQASLRSRVGVYSFARYDPGFRGEQRTAETENLMLRRSCHVLAHETGHMFGIRHCVHFHCVMNGSNHLDEADRQPNHLCPVCLRKLQWACGFDVVDRYTQLKQFAEQADWEKETQWLSGRIEKIRQNE